MAPASEGLCRLCQAANIVATHLQLDPINDGVPVESADASDCGKITLVYWDEGKPYEAIIAVVSVAELP